jgi:ribonuclease J
MLGHASLVEVTPGQRIRVGSFEVEPIRVTHSIADATALAIRSDAGLVVHTGDFKFDDSPPDQETSDVARFAALSTEGVRLLLSDSTNIDARGPTGSEEGVGRALEAMVAEAQGAVVVALFASNVHRLRMLGDIARRHGRKIVALGRSVSTHARVARATTRTTGPLAGAPYLEWPGELVWPAERAGELPRTALLGVATGTQGEAPAALARLARGEHPNFQLAPGDLVVMSSRVIPGKEPGVLRVMSALLRRGVELKSWWSDRDIHVSGHAHPEDQRRMIELCRPRAFVPVHGTLHHLMRHAALARGLGVPEVCVLENGEVGQLGPAEGETLGRAGQVPTGRVHVFAKRAIPAAILRERSALAANGAAHLVVPLDVRNRLAGEVVLTTRGVVDEIVDHELLDAAKREVRAALAVANDAAAPQPAEEPSIIEAARLAVRRAFVSVLGFKPVTTVTVLRIER